MTSDSLQMQLEDQMNQNFSTFVSDVVYEKNLTQISGWKRLAKTDNWNFRSAFLYEHIQSEM